MIQLPYFRHNAICKWSHTSLIEVNQSDVCLKLRKWPRQPMWHLSGNLLMLNCFRKTHFATSLSNSLFPSRLKRVKFQKHQNRIKLCYSWKSFFKIHCCILLYRSNCINGTFTHSGQDQGESGDAILGDKFVEWRTSTLCVYTPTDLGVLSNLSLWLGYWGQPPSHAMTYINGLILIF